MTPGPLLEALAPLTQRAFLDKNAHDLESRNDSSISTGTEDGRYRGRARGWWSVHPRARLPCSPLSPRPAHPGSCPPASRTVGEGREAGHSPAGAHGADTSSQREPHTSHTSVDCYSLKKKARVFQKNIYLCFTDYAKAFDCVDHNKLWKILKKMGIPDHLTCLLRNLYAGQEATVRTGHGTTDWFQIGVYQGCILSPCLFNLYAEYVMRNTELEEAQAAIKIAGNQQPQICR